MDKKKDIKDKSGFIIKMTTDNTTMNSFSFKNFSGAKSFKADIPVSKTNEIETLDTMIKESITGKKSFCEWTVDNMIVKPYYDVDVFIHDDVDCDKEEIEDTVQIQALKAIAKLYPESQIAISSSHGKKTKLEKKINYEGYMVSYHMVVQGFESTLLELKSFHKKNNVMDLKFDQDLIDTLKLDKQHDSLFDNSVYRNGGNLRMIYSYKPNDHRQKIPVTFVDEPLKHIIHSNIHSNVGAVTMKLSPPSSPPSSPKANEKEFLFDIVTQKRTYNSQEIKDILDMLPEECYQYDDWTKIGMSIFNVTSGDNIGLALFNDWSKKDKKTYDRMCVMSNWKYWGNSEIKVGITTLKKYRDKYTPINQQSLQCIYERFAEDGKGLLEARKAMLKEMNNRLVFIKETGEYIILDRKLVRKENGEMINTKCWFLKGPTKAKDGYLKEKFTFFYVNTDGEKQILNIDPFKIWCEWIDRREVRAIGFDPRGESNTDIFNLWNGFNISKEVADQYNEEEAKPVLDHIKELWCQGDENSYNYVLDYFSHIIQKPHIKTGVLLALKSKQGGGKGIILDKLAQIIGSDHYSQNSNAKFLFGDFNGQLEGKILVNLDEAFWGGDKALEGVVKNKITEKRQTINKKNKENYTIDDYANYIITTNNDWFCGVTADDRRHYCLQLSSILCGRMTPKILKRVQPVLDSPAEAFAKVLYNRDITDFKPRIFLKTALLQEQVMRNWNSVRVWWNMVMKEGGFSIGDKFVDWGTLLTESDHMGKDRTVGGIRIKNKNGDKQVVYSKDWIFSVYNSYGADARKFSSEAFYRELSGNCLDELYKDIRVQKQNSRKWYVILPSIQDARDKWNQMEEYEYGYGEADEEWVLDEESDTEAVLSDDE